MDIFTQHETPGVVGISTYVDAAYHEYMQTHAIAIGRLEGPINRLRSVTVTLDFCLLIANLKAGDIQAAEDQVAEVAEGLAAARADFMVVTSGTTSTFTSTAQKNVGLPVLDMAEPCMAAAQDAGASVVGLLSTRQTVRGGLFEAAAQKAGCRLIAPPPDVAEAVDDAIFSELVFGDTSDASTHVFCDAMVGLLEQGAQTVILGNTDLTLILPTLEDAVDVPVVDAARTHAEATARRALGHPIIPADRTAGQADEGG